jgi:putative membrane protein
MKPLQETALVDDDPGVVLASSRTALSFERTRMGADRTLMAIVRTALSLIGFGFTIHTAFQKLAEAGAVSMRTESPRNFGLALIFIGVTLLIMGILSHRKFQRQLNGRHDQLFEQRLVRHATQYTATPTFAAALALLFVGLAAFAVIIFNAG